MRNDKDRSHRVLVKEVSKMKKNIVLTRKNPLSCITMGDVTGAKTELLKVVLRVITIELQQRDVSVSRVVKDLLEGD